MSRASMSEQNICSKGNTPTGNYRIGKRKRRRRRRERRARGPKTLTRGLLGGGGDGGRRRRRGFAVGGAQGPGERAVQVGELPQGRRALHAGHQARPRQRHPLQVSAPLPPPLPRTCLSCGCSSYTRGRSRPCVRVMYRGAVTWSGVAWSDSRGATNRLRPAA